jgi:hypothetical protein
MDEIDELIRKKVEGKVLLQTKRQRFDWDSPIGSIIAGFSAATAVAIIGFAGHRALNVFCISVTVGVGSWLLILFGRNFSFYLAVARFSFTEAPFFIRIAAWTYEQTSCSVLLFADLLVRHRL